MPNHKKPLWLLFVLTVIAGVALLATLRGQSQNNSTFTKQEKIQEDAYPVTDYTVSEPDSHEKRVKRHARGKRNNLRLQNSQDGERFKITERTESSFGGVPFDVPPEPAIPIVQSDAVVIGEVRNAQAYLSEDKTNVYSEFTISISEVLKCGRTVSLLPGASIEAERAGGAVRFPSGKVIKFGSETKPFPRVGRRYVFFLKYNEEGQDFSVITGYELRAGRVFPLDGNDRDGKVFEVYAAYQKYKGADEVSFLNEVRQAIAGSSQGGR